MDAPRAIQVFRCFRLGGLVCATVDHLDSASDSIFQFGGIEKAVVGLKGTSVWSTSTTPSSGSR
jgi:hypothetical protein